jgi:hypothetical protein
VKERLSFEPHNKDGDESYFLSTSSGTSFMMTSSDTSKLLGEDVRFDFSANDFGMGRLSGGSLSVGGNKNATSLWLSGAWISHWRATGDDDYPTEIIARPPPFEKGETKTLAQDWEIHLVADCSSSLVGESRVMCGDQLENDKVSVKAKLAKVPDNNCPPEMIRAVLGDQNNSDWFYDASEHELTIAGAPETLDCAVSYNTSVLCGFEKEEVRVGDCDWDVSLIVSPGHNSMGVGMHSFRANVGGAARPGCPSAQSCNVSFIFEATEVE